jgi:hypothetical protein
VAGLEHDLPLNIAQTRRIQPLAMHFLQGNHEKDGQCAVLTRGFLENQGNALCFGP